MSDDRRLMADDDPVFEIFNETEDREDAREQTDAREDREREGS